MGQIIFPVVSFWHFFITAPNYLKMVNFSQKRESHSPSLGSGSPPLCWQGCLVSLQAAKAVKVPKKVVEWVPMMANGYLMGVKEERQRQGEVLWSNRGGKRVDYP